MRIFLWIAVAGVVAGCGGSAPAGPSGGLDPDPATCGSTVALFTVPPIAVGSLTGWVPLGNLNPPSHTFPTDHQYLYLSDPSHDPVPPVGSVVAPGPITITRAKSTYYQATDHTDYALTFSRCREVAGELGHVQTLEPSLLARLGAFDQACSSYSPAPGQTVTACYSKTPSIAIAAGATIGTAGGVAGQLGLDFSLWDTRVSPILFASPERYPHGADGFDYRHTVPGSDYFAEPAASAIRAKLGAFNGAIQRTVAPFGGTIALDRPGTAQGNWFSPSASTYPESAHLAIVPDNVDPTVLVFSFGVSQPNVASGTYRFTPTHQGTLNRDPAEIGPDGETYCFDLDRPPVITVRMPTDSTLEVRARPDLLSCAAFEPSLGLGGTLYRR